MKEKLYFEMGGENCYTLDYFKELLCDITKEIILQVGTMERGSDYMWCKIIGECIERGSGDCGKLECVDYKPRNGKSGRCISLINCYEPTGPELSLTKEGLKVKV